MKCNRQVEILIDRDGLRRLMLTGLRAWYRAGVFLT